ncbi:glycosyltransferase [Aureimonas psammosilenae]|uniref:glycosyltransferase n=1 Tax=Aureimonas psammosilenae TaxID=2495496 RepID=UPI0012609714|nr:glycosyltransferase family 4 protein [Aureimonas psammosilenae]
MHLLFISSMLPEDEPRSGFDIATRVIADEYRRQGVRLSFAGFRRPESRIPRPGEISLGDLVPENAAVGRRQKMEWLMRAFWSGLPVSAAKLATMDDDALDLRLSASGPVDAFILNSIQMPTAFPFLSSAKPSIFVAHNVEHRSAAENALHAPTAFRRRLYEREARLLKRAEDRVCREARMVHTLSAEDLPGLGLVGNPAAFSLPLTVARPMLPDTGERTHDIGLIGTWSWAPNRIGLDWFLSQIVPLLPSDITIAIAGAFEGRPPKAPPNVRFLGRVPDAQRFVQSSRVLALASKGGTGVQLKTIEALEEGMPAVATRSSLRGIDSVPGNVAVADEAPDFAGALADMVAGVRMGMIGRANGLTFALARRHSLSAAIETTIGNLAAILDRGDRQDRRVRNRTDSPETFEVPAVAAMAGGR